MMLVASLLGSSAVAAVPGGATGGLPGSQPAPGAAGETDYAGKPGPDLATLTTFLDRLFPPQPEPDPARLSLAQVSARAMWPDGAYAGLMTAFVGGIFDRMTELRPSELPGLGASAGNAGSKAKADPQAARDPNYERRMAAFRQLATDELGKISLIVDPSIRSGLARSMARRFDQQQLGEINRFLATSTGALFARQYMQLWVDPDTIRSVLGSVPQIIKLMPEISARVKAVNDRFPKAAAHPKSSSEE
jgi:hypothetical protein